MYTKWCHAVQFIGYSHLKQQHTCCVMLQQNLQQLKNIYTRKDIVMTEIPVTEFHTSLYIIAIRKLSFHVLYVLIIGTHQINNTHWESFKRCGSFQYVPCHCDYSERVFGNFEPHIQFG